MGLYAGLYVLILFYLILQEVAKESKQTNSLVMMIGEKYILRGKWRGNCRLLRLILLL